MRPQEPAWEWEWEWEWAWAWAWAWAQEPVQAPVPVRGPEPGQVLERALVQAQKQALQREQGLVQVLALLEQARRPARALARPLRRCCSSRSA